MDEAYCEALKTAVEFERNGAAFYNELIGKMSDPFAKKVLEFLVDEEIDHIRKIEMFNNSLLGKDFFDFEAECNLELTERIRGLVHEKRQDANKNIASESTDLDIYDVAMLLETKSFELYERELEELGENEDEKVETFLRFLLSEEQEHYDLLASSKRYLTDPSYYFDEYGGWIFG